jgi:hypothetical protein
VTPTRALGLLGVVDLEQLHANPLEGDVSVRVPGLISRSIRANVPRTGTTPTMCTDRAGTEACPHYHHIDQRPTLIDTAHDLPRPDWKRRQAARYASPPTRALHFDDERPHRKLVSTDWRLPLSDIVRCRARGLTQISSLACCPFHRDGVVATPQRPDSTAEVSRHTRQRKVRPQPSTDTEDKSDRRPGLRQPRGARWRAEERSSVPSERESEPTRQIFHRPALPRVSPVFATRVNTLLGPYANSTARTC